MLVRQLWVRNITWSDPKRQNKGKRYVWKAAGRVVHTLPIENVYVILSYCSPIPPSRLYYAYSA